MKKIIQHPIFIAAVALFIGLLIGRNTGADNQTETHSHSNTEVNTYTCSMHPNIRREEPGDCPICGMDLVPLSNVGNQSDSAVFFDAQSINRAQIEVMTIGASESDGNSLVINGEVQYNAGERRSQTAHFSGRLERTYYSSIGEYIEQGEKIAEIYSPELSEVHREILEIKKRYGTDSELMDAGRERLKNLKLPDHQVREMIQAKTAWNTFPVYSEYSGYIEQLNAREGMHLGEGETFFFINEFKSVWAVFDVFEKDLAQIKIGQEIRVRTGQKNQSYEAHVDFISTQIDPKSRTAEVRATLSSSTHDLKPNSLLTGEVLVTAENEEGIFIPETALLWTGKRSIVYIAKPHENGGYHFTLREVTAGERQNKSYPIYAGLEAGEMIAVSGAFVIDASAELNGRASMMSTTSQPRLSLNKEDSLTLVEWVEVYLNMKDALVESQFKEASRIAKRMKQLQLPDYDGNYDLERAAQAVVNSSDLETMRIHFIQLSKELIELSSAIQWDKKLIVQYCPMANKNKGAEWLSKSTEIRNPYYGDAMLTCGEVVRKMK